MIVDNRAWLCDITDMDTRTDCCRRLLRTGVDYDQMCSLQRHSPLEGRGIFALSLKAPQSDPRPGDLPGDRRSGDSSATEHRQHQRLPFACSEQYETCLVCCVIAAVNTGAERNPFSGETVRQPFQDLLNTDSPGFESL